jgi:hypothetical protein
MEGFSLIRKSLVALELFAELRGVRLRRLWWWLSLGRRHPVGQPVDEARPQTPETA